MKEPWISILMALVGLGSLVALAVGLRVLARDLTRRTGVRFNSRFILVNWYNVAWVAIVAYPVLALRWVFRPSKRGVSLDWGEERASVEQNPRLYRSDRTWRS